MTIDFKWVVLKKINIQNQFNKKMIIFLSVILSTFFENYSDTKHETKNIEKRKHFTKYFVKKQLMHNDMFFKNIKVDNVYTVGNVVYIK